MKLSCSRYVTKYLFDPSQLKHELNLDKPEKEKLNTITVQKKINNQNIKKKTNKYDNIQLHSTILFQLIQILCCNDKS